MENPHGEVRQKSAAKRQVGDAQKEERQVEKRPLGQDCQEPQTSDRHRPVGGAQKGGQGAGEEEVEVEIEEKVEQGAGADIKRTVAGRGTICNYFRLTSATRKSTVCRSDA